MRISILVLLVKYDNYLFYYQQLTEIAFFPLKLLVKTQITGLVKIFYASSMIFFGKLYYFLIRKSTDALKCHVTSLNIMYFINIIIFSSLKSFS